MDPPDGENSKQSNLFGNKKSRDVCMGGPSGIFRQSNDQEKNQRPGALTSYARAARQSIGGIGNLISRRITSGGPPPQIPWPNTQIDYDVQDVIGVGATATVHRAFCKPRDEKCAIKKINLEKWNTSMDELLKEIQAMSNCNHENVVTYYTSFVVEDELWLVLKLLEGGSLLDLIKQKMRSQDCKNGVFEESTIATVLKEVLQGLDYFHSNGQIHRDIKAGNILLGNEGDVQIADFGVSAWLAQGKDITRPNIRHTFVGTPCWMAPEVMEQDHGYDFKADIWSFGITAIELATGTAPYHKYPPMKVLMLTLQNDPPTLDSSSDVKDQYKSYGKTFRKMITECLLKDPKKRPTASELLQHPFFKKAKDKKYIAQYFSSIAAKAANQKVNKRTTSTSSTAANIVQQDWIWSDEEDEISSSSFFIKGEVGQDLACSLAIEAKCLSNGKLRYEKTESKKDGTLSFVLRIRNKQGQLDDIRFEFIPEKDAACGVATELENAGLIDPKDKDVITYNLNQLVRNNSTCRTIIFQLNSPSPHSTFNDKVLLGFAQLSLAD